MLDVDQFRKMVVRPTLMHLGLFSPTAENLLIGTALQESRLKYLKQLGGGPAIGLFQIEPKTHDDLWNSYLRYHPALREKVKSLMVPGLDPLIQLATNLTYATAIARLLYFRKQEPLPANPNDVESMALYWKKHYNTPLGAGTVQEFVDNYSRGATTPQDSKVI